MRPKTLAEVARLTLAGDSFDRCLANFLDEFYLSPNAVALTDIPRSLLRRSVISVACKTPISPPLPRNWRAAFVCGRPDWIEDEARKLHHPWFASPLAALRPVLLLESPPGFRARNLFVSENALSRV